MKILVTAATGFIGSYLAHRLSEQGHTVYGFCRSKNWRTDLLPNVHLLSCDIRNEDEVRSHMNFCRPDVIIHVAAAGVQRFPAVSDETLVQSNILGTYFLLKSARDLGVARFILAGSVYEYGPQDHCLSEDSPLKPHDLYSATKASSSLLGLAFAEQYAMRINILRIFTAYGPFEAEHRLIPSLILAGLRNQPVALTSGHQTRDFIFIDDVFQAFSICTTRDIPTGIYNVASGEQVSIREVALCAKELFGGALVLQLGKRDLGKESFWSQCSADVSKAEKVLGFQSKTTLSEGLRLTLQWFSNNEGVVRKCLNG